MKIARKFREKKKKEKLMDFFNFVLRSNFCYTTKQQKEDFVKFIKTIF